MIKKYINYFIRILLIVIVVLPIFNPVSVTAARDKTIKDLKHDLYILKKKKQDSENSKHMTESEIKAAKQKINNSLAEKARIEDEIEESKIKIKQSEEEIEKLKKETQALLRYFQITKGDDVYSEYLSDASSLKDLIRRLAAVEQITDYSNLTLKKLDKLIKDNEQLQIDLNKKTKELEVVVKRTKGELTALEGEVEKITALSVDISTEINTLQSKINHYKSICPNENTPITDCTKLVNAPGWTRPLSRGVITQKWGTVVNVITGKPNYFHNGVDIGGVPEGTNIYAGAPGVVGMIIRRASCGGNQVFIHTIVNGKKYTLHYAHMLNINVRLHQAVDVNTIVGTIGGGRSTMAKYGGYDRCTTGAHLHYGVSKGFYGTDYYNYNMFVLNGINPPGFPRRGIWWNTR